MAQTKLFDGPVAVLDVCVGKHSAENVFLQNAETFLIGAAFGILLLFSNGDAKADESVQSVEQAASCMVRILQMSSGAMNVGTEVDQVVGRTRTFIRYSFTDSSGNKRSARFEISASREGYFDYGLAQSEAILDGSPLNLRVVTEWENKCRARGIVVT